MRFASAPLLCLCSLLSCSPSRGAVECEGAPTCFVQQSGACFWAQPVCCDAAGPACPRLPDATPLQIGTRDGGVAGCDEVLPVQCQ